jgi:cytochrome c oxidase cbb3-type subunit 3
LKRREKRSQRVALIILGSVFVPVALTAVCSLGLAGQNPASQVDGRAIETPATSAVDQPGLSQEAASSAIEQGKALFVSNCAFCHGANAKGGETGPDLIRSLVVLDDDKGERIGAVVLNGRIERGMPKFSFSSEQISKLAAFLHSQIQATAAFNSYQILNIVVGDVKAGETYFNGSGRCAECHSATGDLAHVGSKYTPADLQQKFIMPRSEGEQRESLQPDRSAIKAKITLSSGEIYEGNLLEIDDFKVTVIDAKGKHRTFARDADTLHVELNDPLQEHAKLLSEYTDFEIHNLTAYLVSLK